MGITERAAQRIAQSQLGLRHIDFLNRSGQNETALEECGALIATLETLPAAPFDLLANIHSWCGVLFYHLGQYEAALTAVQRAQQLGRQAGDVAFVAGELANLGMIYMNLGDLDRAVAAFEQAVMELKHFKALGQYLNAVGTLGAVYLLRGELDQAFSCLTEQLALADGLHYVRETARALSNRGAVLMYQGLPDLAPGARPPGRLHWLAGRSGLLLRSAGRDHSRATGGARRVTPGG